MDYSEYVLKYEKLEREYEELKYKELTFENPYTVQLENHPFNNKDWLDYAKDCGFSFKCLQLPRNDIENQRSWYEFVHQDLEDYLKLLTVNKKFIVCPCCMTTWDICIQLTGEYTAYDKYGDIAIAPSNENNKYMFYYKLPEYISTVSDLQKILDVIEMCKHGDQ